MKEEQEKLTKKAVKELGFTDKMIRELLPEPERVPNTKYKRAADICLWKKSTVDAVRQSEKFAQAMKKSEKRRESARKAAERKRNETMEQIEKCLQTIRVSVIDMELLKTRTLKDKTDFEYYKAMERGKEVTTYENPDQETLERWEVNYIRHNLTSYDKALHELLASVFGHVGSPQTYPKFKTAILEKIAVAYPELEQECQRQMERIEFFESMRAQNSLPF